jgi:hypothetical protein
VREILTRPYRTFDMGTDDRSPTIADEPYRRVPANGTDVYLLPDRTRLAAGQLPVVSGEIVRDIGKPAGGVVRDMASSRCTSMLQREPAKAGRSGRVTGSTNTRDHS